MKLSPTHKQSGFTLSEMLIALALGIAILAAIVTASLAMQKSFNAVDNYFATHMQQIRIVDYLNRDAKRAYIVTTSVDLQTVTMTIPRYIIQSGDADASPATVGRARTPTITPTSGGSQVNYQVDALGNPVYSTVVYSINGNTIQRTEDGVVTLIASSTDQLVDQTTDTDLANTEYTRTAVTFRPIFISNNTPAERSGTTVFSLAYLRNKRRG
jgi:prepilin-type N-terminal cleavage/methylation domain-containing protein